MKSFDIGFIIGVVVTTFLAIVLAEVLDLTTTYKESVDQAVESCRDGEWIKVDENTIYCKDGAEYKLED